MKYFTYFFIIFVLAGCSSKNVFVPVVEPESLEYDGRLSGSIYDKTIFGLTLKDGSVIDKDAKKYNLNLPQGYRALSKSENFFVAASKDGVLKVISKSLKVIFEKKYSVAVASATLEENLLAMVLSDNTIILHDISKDELLYKERLNPVYALDARLANPYFLNDLIIFASLDGRVLIMKKESRKIIRDLVVSTHESFNNVIYLNVLNDTMIAATQNRVISITPDTISSFDQTLKDILFVNDKVFIFTKSGLVVLADTKLKVIKQLKFPFAVFSYAAVCKDNIYAVLKNGYMIKMDQELNDSTTYKLPNEINSFVFSTKELIYINNNYIKCQMQ